MYLLWNSVPSISSALLSISFLSSTPSLAANSVLAFDNKNIIAWPISCASVVKTPSRISASSFIGDGSSLTNLQRPITSSTTHFTASNNNTGFYFRGDGSVTCSIQQNSVVTCDIGN